MSERTAPLILCPECRAEMYLFAIEPRTELYDDYTFRCEKCRRFEVRGLRTAFDEAVATADELAKKAQHFYGLAESTADGATKLHLASLADDYAREADEIKRLPITPRSASRNNKIGIRWGAITAGLGFSACFAAFLFFVDREVTVPTEFFERHLTFAPGGDGSFMLFFLMLLVILISGTGIRLAVR
jgi:hypothetical protein